MRCEQVNEKTDGKKAASLQTDNCISPKALQGQCCLQIDSQSHPPTVKAMNV